LDTLERRPQRRGAEHRRAAGPEELLLRPLRPGRPGGEALLPDGGLQPDRRDGGRGPGGPPAPASFALTGNLRSPGGTAQNRPAGGSVSALLRLFQPEYAMIFSRMIGESWTGRGQAVERSYDVKKLIPIRRGPVRRRLGMAWYSARRYLLWCSGKYLFAKSRERRGVLD